MAFEFNWAPTPIPTKLINPNMRAASEAMQGYVPAEADPSKYIATPGIKAAEQMQGYTPALANYSLPNTPVKEQEMQGGNRVPSNVSDELGKGWIYTQQQEQAAAKQQQVDSIKSRIQELESKIAANQAKLKNWSTPAGEIAALEARKINAQDPTSIWRWKVDRDAANAIAREEKEKSNNLANMNAIYEINNDLNSIVVDDKMTSQDQKAYLNKLSSLRTLAQKNGLPTDAIDAKIAEVKGENKANNENQSSLEYKKGTMGENADKAADELLAKPGLTQGDIAKFKRDYPNVSDEKLLELNKKQNELIERDRKNNEAIKKARSLVGKKNLTSKEIEFMNGMKGFKQMTDEYGNVWFNEVL